MRDQMRKAGSATLSSRTRCGVVLADVSLNPLYSNWEAIRILEANPKSAADSIQVRLLEITIGHDLRDPYVAEFRAKRRRYVCRMFPLDADPQLIAKSQQQPAVVFFFERSHITGADLDFIARNFRLTFREKCALSFLTAGLPDKDIAARMSVSPNTVKAFLRNLMAKMGVSTRMELMRKLLDHSYIASSTKEGVAASLIPKRRGISTSPLVEENRPAQK